MIINNWDDFIDYVPEDIKGADFNHYLLCAYWTPREAGYLLNDIDEEQNYPRAGSPMVKTQRLLEKAGQAGLLDKPVGDGYLPCKIIAWAIDNGLKVPEALKNFYEGARPSQKTELTETERQSMLKLIIGMAIHAYGYDPASNRNTATGEKNGISAKLQTHGISIDADTVRKYLNEAGNLL